MHVRVRLSAKRMEGGDRHGTVFLLGYGMVTKPPLSAYLCCMLHCNCLIYFAPPLRLASPRLSPFWEVCLRCWHEIRTHTVSPICVHNVRYRKGRHTFCWRDLRVLVFGCLCFLLICFCPSTCSSILILIFLRVDRSTRSTFLPINE